jgi:hypothetical protein
MQRILAFAFLAAVTNLTGLSYLGADDVVTQRGTIYFAPGSTSGTYYEYRKVEAGNQANQEASDRKAEEREASPRPLLGNLRESLRRRPLFFRRSERQSSSPSSVADSRETPASSPVSQRPNEGPWAQRAVPVTQRNFAAVPVSRNGQPAAARPVSYGIRSGLGSMYPAAIFGQTGPAPSQPAMTYPPSAGAQGLPADINQQKYAYASRCNGCYGGETYYSPGYSSYGYSSPIYNSGYYTSGCYQSNACCRTSRRFCTPFGGMFRGCGCSCYSPPPPPCPTTCYVDPCYGPMGGGAYYAPPAYGTPTPMPSTPAPSTTTPPAPGNIDNGPPQPIEKKVTPEPQANLSPRIPGLPPDA